MNLKNGLGMIKAAASDFLDDNAMTLGASLAFYSALSMAPLLMILITATSFLGSNTQNEIVTQIEAAVGPQAGQAVNFIVSLLVYVALFAMIYKILPDVKISWRDVSVGAALTAVLFVAGKFLLGLYLGRSSVASA